MTTKICSKCKTEKETIYFSKNKTKKDGYATHCKECVYKAYLENKESISLYKKQYRDDNKEKIKQSKKEYYESNKNKIKENHKKYRELHKERLNKISREYHLKNKEIQNIRKKEYRKSEKGKLVFKTARIKRKALIRNATIGNINLKNIIENKICYWCSIKINNEYHIDHYIPIAKGGTHSMDNLVLSCPSCNLKKGSKDPLVFANSIGKLL